MTYEDIVFTWNANAPEGKPYDTLSDRERIEFALSLAGKVEKQELVDRQTRIEMISGAIARHIGGMLSPKAVIAAATYIADHYAAPQPCPSCEKLKAERDNAWEELRRVREAVVANIEESTIDEVRRIVAERDELAAQVEKLRSSLYECSGFLERECSDENSAFARAIEALALPDLSASILNKVRAEAIRKASHDIVLTGDADEFTDTCLRMELRQMAADMEAGK